MRDLSDFPSMRFDRDRLLDLPSALGRRVLLTDGLGGWASTTAIGCPVSRFDGLLVVRPRGDARPVLLVARFDDTIVVGDVPHRLSVLRHRDGLAAGSLVALDRFDDEPVPRWTFRVGALRVVRELVRLRSRPAVAVRWTLDGGDAPAELRLRPHVAARRADALTFRNDVLDATARVSPKGVVVRPYPVHSAVAFTTAGAPWRFDYDPRWDCGVEYVDDLARGYDGHEDLWSPGEFVVDLTTARTVVFAAGADDAVADPGAALAAETGCRRTSTTGVRAALEASADAFLYAAEEGRTGVVAGYPWFGEWGRDTCIALPGLLLARGRVEECGDALSALRPFLRGGRLPVRIGATPAASEYGALDPSLWFAWAVAHFDAAGGTRERLLDDLRPALESIAREYESGDGRDVVCDATGMIRGGSPAAAATWMDAVVEGRAVTPRHGFAVETNALWYALRVHLAEVADGAGDRDAARRHAGFALRLGATFVERLWLGEESLLADQWLDGYPDRSVRPNAVIAVSLARSPLTRRQRAAVVRRARRDLLTPRGLRTLSPEDPAYRGHYRGDVRARDTAYHQGTVWPWLLGAYVEASLRAFGPRRRFVEELRSLLDGFAPHLEEHGLGHVSEVFDGDPPHAPGGTYAQAWSTSELLRAYALLDSAPRVTPRG